MSDTVISRPPAFPVRRGCPMDPPAEYAELAAAGPVSKVTLPTGRTAWVVTGYEHVRQILNDPRVSVNRLAEGYPHVIEMNPQTRVLVGKINETLLGSDPPEHTAHRAMLLNEFTVRRFRAMRPRIQEIVDEYVGRMLDAGPPVDLVQALSLPVPSIVVCELLGVAYADHDFFEQRTRVVLDRTFTENDRITAFIELMAYLDKSVRAQEEQPGDNLIGRLVVKYREAGTYTHETLLSLAMLMLVAGHETTASMISLGTLALLENPEQLALVREDPAMVPQAVDELLRYWSIADVSSGSRVALEDIEIGGVVIRAGDGVIALLSGGNRDGSVFADPDTLDIGRGARHHVAFGYGIHQCIGQNLVRVELETVFRTLLARIPGLRLAVPVDQLAFKDDASIYGVHELPVTW